jgi:DNA-binding MarR family transcriptional regulator
MSSNPTTWRGRDDLIKAVLASKLSDKAVRVLVRLAMFANVNGGQLNPSCKTLAAASGVSERSVYRILEQLERLGWIEVSRTAGRENSYVLGRLTTARAMAVPAGSDTTARAVAVPPLPNSETTTANRWQCKSKRTARKKKGGKPPFPPTRGKAPRNPSLERAAAESFDEFWQAYPRQKNKGSARKAFTTAVRGGAAPAVLIAAARRYAHERADAERDGDDPRFTKYPANWLREECWEDEPAREDGSPIIDNETGEPIPGRPRRRRTEQKTWNDVIEEFNSDDDTIH